MNIEYTKQQFRNAISSFYSGAIMMKCKQNGSYGIWYTKPNTLLGLEERYLVAIIANCIAPLWAKNSLQNLKWHCFQTRTFAEAPVQTDIPISDIDNQISSTELLRNIVKRSSYNNDKSIYFCQKLPIQLELLHVRHCNEISEDYKEYAESGTIENALNTYNCVIRFIL